MLVSKTLFFMPYILSNMDWPTTSYNHYKKEIHVVCILMELSHLRLFHIKNFNAVNLKWHIQWKIKELQLFSISLAICYIKSKFAIQHLSDNFYYNIHLVSSYLYIYKEHKTCYDSLAFILWYICFSYLLQFYIFWHHCYIIYYLKYIYAYASK